MKCKCGNEAILKKRTMCRKCYKEWWENNNLNGSVKKKCRCGNLMVTGMKECSECGLKEYKKYRYDNDENYRKTQMRDSRKHREKKIRECPEYKYYLSLLGRIYQSSKDNNIKLLSTAIKLLNDGTTWQNVVKEISNKFYIRLDGTSMTFNNHGYKGWHSHHKIHINKCNINTLKGQKMAFSYKNIQPLWSEEHINLHKK